MSNTGRVIDAIFKSDEEASKSLNISYRMLERLRESDENLRPWLLKYLVNRYGVNPLYIYGDADNMFLDQNSLSDF